MEGGSDRASLGAGHVEGSGNRKVLGAGRSEDGSGADMARSNNSQVQDPMKQYLKRKDQIAAWQTLETEQVQAMVWYAAGGGAAGNGVESARGGAGGG